MKSFLKSIVSGLPIVLLLALMLLTTGCSQGLKFYKTYGDVTLNGKPIGYAEMHIDPSSDTPNSGRTVHCKIINGSYKSTIPVAGGPAHITLAIVDTSKLKIKDYENMSAMEDDQFLRAPKQLFEIDLTIDREHIDISLPQ